MTDGISEAGSSFVSRPGVHMAWLGAFVLLALHFDFWRGPRPGLVFGWLPEELAYRLGWMLLAWLYLLLFTTLVWRSKDP